jgi:hypothetical protein
MPNDPKKIQDIFYNALLTLSDADDGVTKELLEQNGINHEDTVNSSLKSIKKYEFILKAKVAKERHDNLYERAMEKLKKLMIEAPERTNQLLSNLLQQRAPSFQFRNLDKWDAGQMNDVLNELDIIELIEKLDNNEEK